MIRKYISDIITPDEISKWKSGDRILIHSQTGSGKSEFIKNNLYDHCVLNDKKILLLSNRNLLKNQNLIDIEDKLDYIDALNYQQLEAKVIGGFSPTELFSPYDYIVYDEAHYMFADSSFNRNTDLLLEPVKNTPDDKILIFITATPDALLDYQPEYSYKYNLQQDYSYIKNIYFYNRLSTIESIIKNIPYNEKVIYFGSNAQQTWEESIKFKDSTFICSVSNKLHNKSDQNTIKQIVRECRFDSRLLFATKLLDNGVNIKDHEIKHIIIDMLDPISFIQCLGRKRYLIEDDNITLYIKNYHGGKIYYVLSDINSKLKFIVDFNELPEKDFINKYRKENFDGLIDNDMKINWAKYQYYLTQKRLLENMFLDQEKIGYKKYICKLLDFDTSKIKSADQEFETLSMRKLLRKYVGIKMFKDDREKFKILFFNNIFTPKKTDYIARGIKAIGGILEENRLRFEIHSRQETKGSNRNKTYWIIEKEI